MNLPAPTPLVGTGFSAYVLASDITDGIPAAVVAGVFVLAGIAYQGKTSSDARKAKEANRETLKIAKSNTKKINALLHIVANSMNDQRYARELRTLAHDENEEEAA